MKNPIIVIIITLSLGIISSCTSELDIQQVYTFELQTLPVPKKLVNGETAVIRCSLIKEGSYDDALFTIRYFQPDGNGELKMDNGTVLLPNDRYQLKKISFRLYYTSRCEEQQTIDIYIEDNFGQVVQKTFSWQNNGNGDENEDSE